MRKLIELKRIVPIFIVLSGLIKPSYCEDFLYIDTSIKPYENDQLLSLASRFYGLDFKHLLIDKYDDINSEIDKIIEESDLNAILINSNVLFYENIGRVLNQLLKMDSKVFLIMILGITSNTPFDELVKWSDGAINGCQNFSSALSDAYYCIGDFKDIARQVGGQDIPFSKKIINCFSLGDTKKASVIISIKDSNSTEILPTFVWTKFSNMEIFFHVYTDASNSSTESSHQSTRNLFFEIVPLLMFLRYSCGERCLHSNRNYANLIVDDPWLTEPYGHLSYVKLLEEMKKSNFHTTIAFIPWNYDRSKQDVVSLFRGHLDKFSICIHGNNHDHYEFYKYETKPVDLWPARPVDVQEANIKQALVRMEIFRNLTGIPYDKVMVFPHGIAPAKTLGLLKKYNFLSTVNAGYIPLNTNEPGDALFRLRPIALKFENFPSLNRYTSNRDQSDIAIDLFLDIPILFYAHQDFFKDGIDAFNETANKVNNIQPDIVWKSLGFICQHLYLEKLRDDGHYDVLAFSSNFVLENTHQRNLTYYVRKEESFSFPIKQVTVDGHPYSYKILGNDLMLKVNLLAAESRHIVIEYENELDLSSIDVSKSNSEVNRLRRLSDFRDMKLSRNVVGRAISNFYYKTGLYKLGLKRLTAIILILTVTIILVIFWIWYFIRRKKRQSKS